MNENYLNISNLYNTYNLGNDQYFKLLNKSIIFPQDSTLDIYDFKFINADVAWTVLSWQLYGTIHNWWILSSLNPKGSYYFAPEGSTVKYIKPEYINLVISRIKERM